jgi:hypothetical protein
MTQPSAPSPSPPPANTACAGRRFWRGQLALEQRTKDMLSSCRSTPAPYHSQSLPPRAPVSHEEVVHGSRGRACESRLRVTREHERATSA